MEKLKPFSIFVKNIGERKVVAERLIWELTRADGTTTAEVHSRVTSWVFMGGGEAGADPSTAAGEGVIIPGSFHFFSLAPISAVSEEGQDANQTARLNELSAELEQCTNITVSIDGVFFEDGTFVGPDNTGFFAQVKAHVDAKYDLLREVELSIKNNKGLEDFLNYVEQLANKPNGRRGPKATPDDHYNFYKKRFAEEFVGVQRNHGRDEAIAAAIRQVNRPWPMLQKKR